MDTQRLSPDLERGFCKSIQREDGEEPLYFLGASSLGSAILERLAVGLKAPEVLKFVTFFIPVPWLCAIIIAETRRFWFL